MSAVVVFVIDVPPSVVAELRRDEHDGAEQHVHGEICDFTISLKVSAWLRILILAAIRDTSTASSNRSSLRALLSRTSLKPSRKSVSRSNSRRSHCADFLLLGLSRRFFRWNMMAAPRR